MNIPRDQILSVDISVRDIGVRNLSTFKINEAHISMDDLTLSLELNVPSLRVRQIIRLIGRESSSRNSLDC